MLRILSMALFSSNNLRLTQLAGGFFCLSFLIALFVGCSSSEFTLQHSILNTTSALCLGIGTSLLATALITGVESLQLEKSSILLNLFSAIRDKPIHIVIPTVDENYFLPNKAKEEHSITQPFQGWKGVAAADFRTLKYLIALFQGHGLPLPIVINDEDVLPMLNDPVKSKEIGGLVVIGLYSNKFTNAINSGDIKSRGKSFIFGDRSYENPGSRSICITTNQSTGVPRKHTPNENQCVDFAVLSKFIIEPKHNQQLTVTVLGGLNMTGTHLIGKFIHDHWYDRIAKENVETTGGRNKPIDECSYFTAVYEVESKTSNTRFADDGVVQARPFKLVGE